MSNPKCLPYYNTVLHPNEHLAFAISERCRNISLHSKAPLEWLLASTAMITVLVALAIVRLLI